MEYTFMNKTTPVFSCEIGDDGGVEEINEVFNPEYLPVGITRGKSDLTQIDFWEWWRNRSIPASRKELETVLIKANLTGIPQLLKKSLGLSLSDQYWLNPEGSLSWDGVNFFNNSFSDDIGDLLIEQHLDSEQMDFRSPDVTVDGTLKKRWKVIGDERYLIKGGNPTIYQEPYNECFASAALKTLGHENYVDYEVVEMNNEPYSKCRDFISENTEYVTAMQILMAFDRDDSLSLFNQLLQNCEKLGIPGMKSHLDQMLAFDYIILNVDRHLGNFGAIRNVETLKWILPAPIFDNGNSLWYGFHQDNIGNLGYNKARPFGETQSEQLNLVSSFDWIDEESLTGLYDILTGIFGKSINIPSKRIAKIAESLAQRIDMLKQHIESRH
jgi:hypothetical protein